MRHAQKHPPDRFIQMLAVTAHQYHDQDGIDREPPEHEGQGFDRADVRPLHIVDDHRRPARPAKMAPTTSNSSAPTASDEEVGTGCGKDRTVAPEIAINSPHKLFDHAVLQIRSRQDHSGPTERSNPSDRAASVANAVLPMPDSPSMLTSHGWPASIFVQTSPIRANSSCLPTNDVVYLPVDHETTHPSRDFQRTRTHPN